MKVVKNSEAYNACVGIISGKMNLSNVKWDVSWLCVANQLIFLVSILLEILKSFGICFLENSSPHGIILGILKSFGFCFLEKLLSSWYTFYFLVWYVSSFWLLSYKVLHWTSKRGSRHFWESFLLWPWYTLLYHSLLAQAFRVSDCQHP